MRVKYCREMKIEEFEEMLAKVSNNGVSLIIDQDGWSYGSSEEFGDVTNEIVENMIEKKIEHPVDNIYIDINSDVVIITSSIE